MSPTRRPSSVAGLRRAVQDAPAPAAQAVVSTAPVRPAERVKPVRVTLNFPPELFRQLDHWTREAADTLGVPRLGVQDAVRAMVKVLAGGEARNAEAQVLAELRRNRQG